MISAILIILASICNAIMDICSHKFFNSVFYKENNIKWNTFFNTDISWKNKYIKGDVSLGRLYMKVLWFNIKKPVQITDSFHLFKSIMLILLISAISVYEIYPLILSQNQYMNIFLNILFFGLLWNFTFNMFYNKILIRK